jgi:cephalosporin hydroxylase
MKPELLAAYDRTEEEVVRLASQSAYLRDELAIFRRRSRFSFYSSVSPVWLMEHGERAALSMLVNLIKPNVVIEIGTRFGGSAFLFSQTANKLICIDIDDAVRERTSGIPNIEVIIGNSTDVIPRVLSDLRNSGSDFDLALIDGDHTSDGVKADIEAFISDRPTRPCWLIMHDTFNPVVRAGIRSVNWDRPWVAQVEIDFVPGNVMHDRHVRNQLWGGIGIVELQPTDRETPLIVNEEARLLYEAALKFGSRLGTLRKIKRRLMRLSGLEPGNTPL